MGFLFLLIALIVVAIVILIQGLIYWGIGAFICWAFSIPFTFTFVHGIAIGLIVSILSSIFNVTVNKIGD